MMSDLGSLLVGVVAATAPLVGARLVVERWRPIGWRAIALAVAVVIAWMGIVGGAILLRNPV